MIKINDNYTILNDITCTPSGLGDRLLDIISGIVVSKLLNIKYICKWANNTALNSYRKYNYNKDLINIKDVIIYNDDQDIELSFPVVLNYSLCNVIDNYTAATTTPSVLKNKLNVLFDINSDLINLINLYKNVPTDIKPSDEILSYIKTDLNDYIGLHIRITDKLTQDKDCNYEMTLDECRNIIYKSQLYIIELINEGNTKFFISTDNYDNGLLFKQWIESLGAECYMNDKINIDSFNEILDLFSLSKCKKIVQITKYSTYSIVASLIGDNKELINFYGPDNNLLKHWEEVLNVSYI